MAIDRSQNGIGLIELLIVMAIITTGLVYLLGMASFSLRISGEKEKISQANFMAQEIMEGVRNFRDGTDWQMDGLGTLSILTPYHLEKTGFPAGWTLVLGEEIANGFTRSVIFSEVRRDDNDDIIENGGTLDTESKKITVSVLWTERGESQQITLISFLTNWK